MGRPGRKRSAEARRRQSTRAGRRPADGGTAEWQAKRRLIVGADGARDPRAGDPLGVLQMTGHITREQMDGGLGLCGDALARLWQADALHPYL